MPGMCFVNIVLDCFEMVIVFYLFTNSRARRIYEAFKESSSDKLCADSEVFSSMLESRPSDFCKLWVGIISYTGFD